MVYDSRLKSRLIAAAVGSVVLFAMYQWMGGMPDDPYADETMKRQRMLQMQYEHAQRIHEATRTNMSAEQFTQSLSQMNQMDQANYSNY